MEAQGILALAFLAILMRRSHSHSEGTLNFRPVILFIFFLSNTSDRHEKDLISAWCVHELWCP